MESIVLHRQKELSFDVNKCIICQKMVPWGLLKMVGLESLKQPRYEKQ